MAAPTFTTTQNYLLAWTDFNNRTGYNNIASYPNLAAQVPGVTTAYVVQNNGGSYYDTITGLPPGTRYNIYPVGATVIDADLPTAANAPYSAINLQDMYANPGNWDNNASGLRSGAVCNQLATGAQMQAIGLGSTQDKCVYSDFGQPGNPNYVATPGLAGSCAMMSGGNPSLAVNAWENNYMCVGTLPNASAFIGSATSTPAAPMNQGVTNVEYMKEELLVNIAGRLGGTYCADINIPTSQPSGVKLFPDGTPGTAGTAEAFDPTYAGSGASRWVNFENVGTPWAYLQQIQWLRWQSR